MFTAPVREVADLATRLPDVRWLELEPRMKEDDVNASRFIQGGTNDTATVWDRGLHGEGQIIGMLEGGTPDIGHCFFSDPAPNTPGPGHRKMVSLRNASIEPHATFVAGCAVGDERGNSRCQQPSRQRMGRPARGRRRPATPHCSPSSPTT